MINNNQLNLISQVLTSMDQLARLIDEAYQNNDSEKLEGAKQELLNFQKKLQEELK